MPQRELAAHVGLSRSRVSEVLSEKPVRTEKADKTPRQLVRYEINSGTRPADAAARIRKTFGDAFADALKAAL